MNLYLYIIGHVGPASEKVRADYAKVNWTQLFNRPQGTVRMPQEMIP